MIRFAGTALLLAFAASLAGAQRYRVAVGSPGTSTRSVIEFRPCIPVEGSDCGAWLTPADEPSAGTIEVTLPALQHETTPNGRFAVSIRDGAVMITSLAGKDSGRATRATGLHGRASAIAVSGDSEFAFALTIGQDKSASEVCMIYLDWRSVFARQTLAAPAAGLSIVR